MSSDPDVRRFVFALAFFAVCLGLTVGLLFLGLWH